MKKRLDSIEKKKKTKTKGKKKSTILAKLEKKAAKPVKLTRKQLLITGAVFTVLALFFIFCLASSIALAGRIYPNVWIGDINLGNKTPKQAEEILTQRLKNYLDGTVLTLSSNQKSFELKPKDIEASFDLEKTSQSLFDIGHGQNFILAGLVRLGLIFKPIQMSAWVNLDQDKWEDFANGIVEKVDVPFKNAGLKFENSQIIEVASSIGVRLEKPILQLRLKEAIGTFQTEPVDLPLVLAFPKIEQEDTLLAREEAEKMISEQLTIVYKDKKFTVSPDYIGSWILFKESPKNKVLGAKSGENPTSSFITTSDYTLIAQLDETKIKEHIDRIAAQIDVAPQNAGLAFSGGRLRVVSPSVTGRAVDREKLFSDIQTALKSESYRKITIKIVTTVSEVREDNYITLGITELISEGISSLVGSPRNRIHNIKVGASKFNGVLIKPGGTFSFNKTLGAVGPQTGYLPELVIKDRKTIPEYGGGLCQVSTTTFRAALLAGLPIVERKEHAYRVRYYDWPYGPGVDATVYLPSPDLKFKNDTGHWILIQTRVSGSKLSFYFYGTKGGRTAVINRSKILWRGADGAMGTEFTRQVFQNGQLVRTDTFRSKFKSPSLFPKPVVETGAPVEEQ